MAAAVSLAKRKRTQDLRQLRHAALEPVSIRTTRMSLTADGLTVVSRRRINPQDSATDARQRAEERKREKWLQELRSLVVATSLPVTA